MTIYVEWGNEPLDGNKAPQLTAKACFAGCQSLIRNNTYVYMEIAQPHSWVPGFDIAVQECVAYTQQFLPVRLLHYENGSRSGVSYEQLNLTDGAVEIAEIAYTKDTAQDMLFFVLNHIRFISPEFYNNGIRFKAGPVYTVSYPPIPVRSTDTEITSYRMYLDTILYEIPSEHNHVPVRYGGSFRGNGLPRAQILEYWFDGPLHWSGAPIQTFAYFQSIDEPEIEKQLQLRKEATKE